MPINAPFGFRPARHLTGGDANRSREYPIATGYNTDLYTGDVVKLLNDGTIARAAAGDRILGIFQGVRYVDSNGNQVFDGRWPASTTATDIGAQVIDDPAVIFQAQFGVATSLTQANVGELTDHVVGTGSNVTKQSGAYLDASTGTGSAGFRIIGLAKFPGNTGAYAIAECTIVEHEHSRDDPATPGI